MRTRPSSLAGAAVALVLSLLALAAPPASAAVTVTATLGGTSSFLLYPGNGSAPLPYAFSLPHGVCDPGAASTLDLGVDDPSNGLVDLDAADIHFATRTWTYGSNDFRVALVGAADTTGAISATSSGAISFGLTLRMIVSTCDGVSTLCTTNPFSLTVAGTHATTAAGGARTGTALLTGSTAINGVTAPVTCNSTVRMLLNNSEADIVLDLTLT